MNSASSLMELRKSYESHQGLSRCRNTKPLARYFMVLSVLCKSDLAFNPTAQPLLSASTANLPKLVRAYPGATSLARLSETSVMQG